MKRNIAKVMIGGVLLMCGAQASAWEESPWGVYYLMNAAEFKPQVVNRANGAGNGANPPVYTTIYSDTGYGVCTGETPVVKKAIVQNSDPTTFKKMEFLVSTLMREGEGVRLRGTCINNPDTTDTDHPKVFDVEGVWAADMTPSS